MADDKKKTPLEQATDDAFRFLANLNLQDHSIAEQREQRRVVQALGKALQQKRDIEGALEVLGASSVVSMPIRHEKLIAPDAAAIVPIRDQCKAYRELNDRFSSVYYCTHRVGHTTMHKDTTGVEWHVFQPGDRVTAPDPYGAGKVVKNEVHPTYGVLIHVRLGRGFGVLTFKPELLKINQRVRA